MASPARVPTGLQPNWRHIPRLAWVVARAFLDRGWPGRVAGVWAVSPAALLYLPLLVSAALRQHLAATPDNGGVVLVWTGRRDRLTLITVAMIEIASFVATSNVGIDLALTTATTWTGITVVTLAFAAVLTTILLPALVEATVILGQRSRTQAVSAERYTAQLRRNGHTAWAIGPWAASPPGRRAGTALVDQVLPEVPAGVWLVALARDTHIAETLGARGFLTPAGGGLLRVRPPAGQTPPRA